MTMRWQLPNDDRQASIAPIGSKIAAWFCSAIQLLTVRLSERADTPVDGTWHRVSFVAHVPADRTLLKPDPLALLSAGNHLGHAYGFDFMDGWRIRQVAACAPWCRTAADRVTTGNPLFDQYHTPDECISETLDTITGLNPANWEEDAGGHYGPVPGWLSAIRSGLQREPEGHSILLQVGRVEVATVAECMEGDFAILSLDGAARLRDQLTELIERAGADTANRPKRDENAA